MDDQWYYASKGRQVGPVSRGELLQLMSSGVVTNSTLVCGFGMAEWVQAGACAALRPESVPPRAANQPSGTASPPLPEARTTTPHIVAAGQAIQYASYFQRWLSTLVDFLVVILIGALTFGIISGTHHGNPGPNALAVGLIGWIVGAWLYHAIADSSSSQCTLGMRLAKIRLTDVQGRRVGFMRATLRWLCSVIPPWGVTFWFTKRKQFTQDILTGCVLVRRP
jgi:uncharacterized RDD family membrane protein YckC